MRDSLTDQKSLRCLPGKASVESAIFVGPLPRSAQVVSRVERIARIANLSITQWHQRRIPDKIRHLATNVIGHRFHVDRSPAAGTYLIALADVIETDGTAKDGYYVTERSGVLCLESFQHRPGL